MNAGRGEGVLSKDGLTAYDNTIKREILTAQAVLARFPILKGWDDTERQQNYRRVDHQRRLIVEAPGYDALSVVADADGERIVGHILRLIRQATIVHTQGFLRALKGSLRLV